MGERREQLFYLGKRAEWAGLCVVSSRRSGSGIQLS